MRNLKKAIAPVICGVLPLGASSALAAAPVAGQILPVAVYHSTPSAFGIAFDSVNNLIWYSQGDSGDDLIHSLKPFESFTAAELAGLPQTGGIYDISLTDGLHDVAGTTTVTGPGGSGGGAHFSSLAFDSSTGKLVYTSSGSLRSVDPITGANDVAGGPPSGFQDGLDIDGGVTWSSPDVGEIYKDGALFATAGGANAALAGTGISVSGFSGVEQIGNSLFAVAVGSIGGEERSIFKYDAITGELVGYDPDGDPVATRWEDMAYDGKYLYAADLRGNRDGTGPSGDIYVFEAGGGIVIPPSGVPDGGSSLLMLLGAFGTIFGSLRAQIKKLG
ncbi:MAG: hypothetical protein R3F19_30870 [Verrucomicrobiales bacterium]